MLNNTENADYFLIKVAFIFGFTLEFNDIQKFKFTLIILITSTGRFTKF